MKVLERANQRIDEAGQNPRSVGETARRKGWGILAIGITSIATIVGVNAVADTATDGAIHAVNNLSANPLKQPIRFANWIGSKIEFGGGDGEVSVRVTDGNNTGVSPRENQPGSAGEVDLDELASSDRVFDLGSAVCSGVTDLESIEYGPFVFHDVEKRYSALGGNQDMVDDVIAGLRELNSSLELDSIGNTPMLWYEDCVPAGQ